MMVQSSVSLIPNPEYAIHLIESNEYVVRWGFEFESTEDDDQVILVYPKNAYENGGYVGFASGATEKLTASEFSSKMKTPPNSVAVRNSKDSSSTESLREKDASELNR